MRYTHHAIRKITATWMGSYLEIYYALKKTKKFLIPIFAKSDNSFQPGFPLIDRKRIQLYALMGYLFGKNYSKILQYKPDAEMEQMFVFQGALTPIFDDFFDNQNLEFQEILDRVNEYSSFQPKNHLDYLFKIFISYIHEHHPNMPQVLNAAEDVFHAQILSMKQKEPISTEEIKEITRLKGGTSFIFLRSIIPYPISSEEKEIIMQLGFTLQLQNDLFDVYKDSREGIKTLVTTTNDLNEIKELFTDSIHKTVKVYIFHDLPVNLKRFYLSKILFIFSKAYVCFDQLMQLQNQYLCWDPLNYERKDLICDLEKPENIYKTLRYFLKFRY